MKYFVEYYTYQKEVANGECFQKIFQNGVACQKKLVTYQRITNGRSEMTSFCIVDAQSVKNTDTARNKGYDAGKKVSGIKRHIAVDSQGLPHAILITTANVTDRVGAIMMFESARGNLAEVKNILVDGGYRGEKFATSVDEILCATVEVAIRNELPQFVVLPKRWIVERSFSWLEKCRRLWKNCERLINTSTHMVLSRTYALTTNMLLCLKTKLAWIKDEKEKFLNRERFNGHDLFNENKAELDLQGGVLSIDDSVLDKLYSNPEHAKLIDYYWSGKHHKPVKGINLVTLFYTDTSGKCLPVNYRIYDKSHNKTKNDYFREMLIEVINWGLAPKIVTGDSWYSGLMNLKHVRKSGQLYQSFGYAGVSGKWKNRISERIWQFTGKLNAITERQNKFVILKSFKFAKVMQYGIIFTVRYVPFANWKYQKLNRQLQTGIKFSGNYLMKLLLLLLKVLALVV
eukprot:403335373